MNRVVNIVFLLLFVASLKAQQDPQYSQYMFNQLVINPAYTGSKEALTVGLSNRNQWVSMPGAPKTVSLFIHGPLKSKKIGWGGHLISESIGPVKWSGIYGDFAYRIVLPKGKLSFGLSAGILGYAFDVSQMKYKEAGESIINGPTNSGALDFNTGFYYYTGSFYIGGSLTHLNKAKVYNQGTTSIQLRPHCFIYMGKAWELNENLVFNPSVMLKTLTEGDYSALDLNVNFLIRNRLWLGLSARQKYGMVFLIQYLVNDKFKIGYSYDKGANRIGTAGHATHEIMLSYDFNVFKPKMLSPRFL